MAAMARKGKRRIVVGVDGSDGSRNALRWAAHLAGVLDARLDVVGAWDYTPLFGFTAAAEFEFPEADIERSLNETVEEVLGAGRPVDLRVKALAGPAAETLLTVSEGAYLLVVGSRGRGSFGGTLLGSVGGRVAEHAECPVLVVHGDESPDQ